MQYIILQENVSLLHYPYISVYGKLHRF